MAAVTECGLWDRTYWVLTSDHGYNLGHHRIPSNKFLLFDHSLRIPMVVRGPGIAPGTNGVVSTLRSHRLHRAVTSPCHRNSGRSSCQMLACGTRAQY